MTEHVMQHNTLFNKGMKLSSNSVQGSQHLFHVYHITRLPVSLYAVM